MADPQASSADALFDAATGLQGTDAQLASISELMEREDRLQHQLETQEALEADLRGQLQELRTKHLPEAMMAAGVDRFRCASTGTEARLTFECAGGLGEDEQERERKLDLLIANGADEIVKTEVTAAFNKDEYHRAMALLGELQRRGLPTILKRNIHPMTLKAWVKERVAGGAVLPLDDIGLWYGQIAKIKRPKADG
jgi:hypothetical protein